jgi:class 3 adenylate cyclase
MEPRHVALVMVDIGGYTRFIKAHKTALLHAQEVVSQLLEAIVDHASFPLTLNKLEGDAALLYAETGVTEAAVVRDIAWQVAAFFAAFHAKAKELSSSRHNCPCDACQHILDLRLKAVLHHGFVAIRIIRQFEVLTGEDVILLYRLLKNSVSKPEYILMSASFHHLAGDLSGYQREAGEETYNDLDRIDTVVFSPRRILTSQALGAM